MSKYDPLWKYLKDNKKNSYKMSYKEIENILNFEIDHSFFNLQKRVKRIRV